MKKLTKIGTPTTLGITLLAASAATLSAQQGPPVNLHVLPSEITARELNEVMVGNLRGLGLPRRQSEGCLYCHVGSMDEPANSWNYALDDKVTKRKARTMLAMVQDINSRLEALEGRVAPDLKVTCYTCHKGRTDPRPLPEVLMASYEEGGVESAVSRYRALRDRYFGADAYDFRANVLASVANALVQSGAWDDALAISSLNEEVFPDLTGVRSFTVTLRVRRAMSEQGVEAGFAVFDEARATEPEVVVNWSILDNLGWGFNRADRGAEAMQIFLKNLETFPDQYVPNESYGDALWFSGEQERGMAVLEEWIERHPGHTMATRRLATMKSQFGG